MLSIEACNQHPRLKTDLAPLRRAIESVLAEGGIERGYVSLAVVDDPTIHQLNRQFLSHDYPTDVLSFVLDASEGQLEGEIIVSSDTAARAAEQYGWTADDELLLYVIHGALHLIGYDDHEEADRQQMRSAERRHLAHFGLTPHERSTTPAAPDECNH